MCTNLLNTQNGLILIRAKGLKIAVLGKSPVLDHLKQLAAKKGHSVSVMKKITEATKYDVIFITEGQSKKLSEIEEVVGNKSTLIITEQDGLAQAGSTVNFVNRNGAIAFEVNQNSLSRYNLKMSSEIKKLAILL